MELVEPAEEPAPPTGQLELLAREAHELRARTRKLQMEGDEKNEIIGVLRDELETLKEQNDKFQRDNLLLLKDSKRAKELQDENDYLQDKLADIDKLECEARKLRDKLTELDFLKIRNNELQDDLARARADLEQAEQGQAQAQARLARLADLESELERWKEFAHELQADKANAHAKLLEAIEHEAKLRATREKLEDELRRLKALVKTLEQQRDEDQASNSLVLTCPLESDSANHQDSQSGPNSIKFELNRQLEQELEQQNKTLKSQLDKSQAELEKLQAEHKATLAELQANRKLISDLRQDLASEKNIAAKLDAQLANLTKQIKNLDKQYFPTHDQTQQQTTASSTTSASVTACIKSSVSSQTTYNQKANEKKPVQSERKSIQSSPAQATLDTSASDKIKTNADGPVNKVNKTQQYQNNNLTLEPKPQHKLSPSDATRLAQNIPEQQLAHLTSLHHQYYYHHLQHMHHLHHLHLQHHRLHQKQRHNQANSSSGSAALELDQPGKSASKNVSLDAKTTISQSKPIEPLYSGGSQFYAPALHLDPAYADLTANNSVNLINEHHAPHARLVSNKNSNAKSQPPPIIHEDLETLRSNSTRLNQTQNSEKSIHQLSHPKVSRVSEVNGLPTIPDVNYSTQEERALRSRVSTDSKATDIQNNSSSPTNGHSPSSSSSSSPTSSASSNLIQSSAASSSSSSINSMSASGSLLKKTAFRKTITDSNCHQYGVEHDLTNATPMKATLMRVGSCRVNRVHQGNSLVHDSILLRTPAVTNQQQQQPSMRASKILNLSHQQTSDGIYATCQQQHKGHAQPEALEGLNLPTRINSNVGRNEMLANNLANIKLNDRLAFASLRLPKKSIERSSLGCKHWIAGDQDAQGRSRSSRIGSLSPDNRSLALMKNVINNGKAQNITATKPSGNNINTNGILNNNNNNTTNGNLSKSSVWFEYGCV